MASHDKTGWLVFGVSDEISCLPWVTIDYYFLPACIFYAVTEIVLFLRKGLYLGNSTTNKTISEI